MLYPKGLFEDQGHSSEKPCNSVLATLWTDALRFYGIEMHRSCLFMTYNADFETIEGTPLRAAMEVRNLTMAADLIMNADQIADAETLCGLAIQSNGKDVL